MSAAKLTHFDYSVACARLGLEKRQAVRLHVQVKKQGAVLCGQVVECCEYSHAGEWFKVDTQQLGRISVESRNVRLCSGDGRCVCEGLAA